MQNFQNNFNNFIGQFQDRWERDSNFRAVWSTIGSIGVLVFMSIMIMTLSRLGTAFLLGQNNSTSTGSTVVTSQGAVNDVPTYSVPPYASIPPFNTPLPNVIATAVGPSPTPTIPPTPIGATPTPTAAPTATISLTPSPTSTSGNFAVTASQSPNPWTKSSTNSIILTLVPPQQNATASISLDFGNGCKTTLPDAPISNATTNIPFTLPNCVNHFSTGTYTVTTTIVIGSNTSSTTFTYNS